MALGDYSFLPFGAVGISGATPPRWYIGTTVPTTGTFNVGDFVFNNSPVAAVAEGAATTFGWLCTTATTAAGVAAVFTTVRSPAANTTSTVTATTGTLTAGNRLFLLNAATGPTLSLPASTSYSTSSQVTIINIANNSATLTPLAANQYQGGSIAAVTLTQYQILNLTTDSSTNWYKAS